jgi:hypothetical protein
MHCISDPCEANCSRCSWHWPGALSAHTVSISSIMAHPSSRKTRTVASGNVAFSFDDHNISTPPHRGCPNAAGSEFDPPDENVAPLDFPHPALGKRDKVSQCLIVSPRESRANELE